MNWRVRRGLVYTHQPLTPSGLGAVNPANTWNPSDKNALITLTGSDLIATKASAANYATVRSTLGIAASEKKYFEVYCNAVTSIGNTGPGVANATASLADGQYIGLDNNGVGVYGADIYRNNAIVGTSVAMAASAAGCIAVDLVNNRFWVRKDGGIWNNNAANDPTTNVGGIDISAVTGTLYAALTVRSANDQWTLRAKTADFGFTVPSGFSALGL